MGQPQTGSFGLLPYDFTHAVPSVGIAEREAWVTCGESNAQSFGPRRRIETATR